jgi:Uma2 family endonuclease
VVVPGRLASRRIKEHAGADQFMYWVEGDPTQRRAPDVYVLPGVSQRRVLSSWKVFETGIAPSFALEVVPGDIEKDHVDVPVDYSHMGVRELVLFDPHVTARSTRRVRWQV